MQGCSIEAMKENLPLTKNLSGLFYLELEEIVSLISLLTKIIP